MSARNSRELCDRLSGHIKGYLTHSLRRNSPLNDHGLFLTPSAGNSRTRKLSAAKSNVSRAIFGNRRDFKPTESLGLKSERVVEAPLWALNSPNDRTQRVKMLHTSERLGEAKKAPFGESLAAVDTETVDGAGGLKTKDTKAPKQGLQDDAEEHSINPQISTQDHPDPHAENESLVDEDVRKGLVADSQVQYGHDRERR